MSGCNNNCQNAQSQPQPPPPPESPPRPSAKDKDHIKCPQFTGNNFPTWKRKVTLFLRVKKLVKCISKPIPEGASETILDQYTEATCILGCHVSDEVYNHIINQDNIDNAYTIWTELTQEYASTSVLAIYQAWCKWEDVQ